MAKIDRDEAIGLDQLYGPIWEFQIVTIRETIGNLEKIWDKELCASIMEELKAMMTCYDSDKDLAYPEIPNELKARIKHVRRATLREFNRICRTWEKHNTVVLDSKIFFLLS